MKHIMIPFQVKNDSLASVKSMIRTFVSAIRKNEPGTLMYKSFQQSDDPTKFVHIMSFENEEVMEWHKNTGYCKQFVEKLYPLCTELPKPIMYQEIE